MTTGDLTRPIIGIENRSAAEVFDIMCDRIRRAHARQAGAQEPVAVPARMTADEAWQDLCEKDDRTSIDYPGFALIRQDELAAYMAAAPVSPATDSGADTRPANCRFRLEDEGRPHPKSNCNVPGCRGVFGALCRAALSPSPSQWNAGAEAKVREALEWYAEQVAGCRKLGNIGDPARHELDRDGGKRAREALAALPLPTPAGGNKPPVGETIEQRGLRKRLAARKIPDLVQCHECGKRIEAADAQWTEDESCFCPHHPLPTPAGEG